MKIYLNLTYGDLDKDISKLRTYAVTLHSVDPELENSIENVIYALTRYRNMYRKEYRHHMEHKEYLRKAEARANYYRMENEKLREK